MKIWKLGQNALAAAASKQQKLGFRQVDAEPIQLTAKLVNITGSEDPRTDVAPTVTPRFFQETEGDTQNLETAVVVLDSNTVQSEEKQLRKRKCNIMNHMQITMIEQAL
ncbi:hypothetical protein HanPSC8_Chr17g0793801 [Helianthus annuus]|nr:hypothetical protein HanPSC8_Chr17g0793801 [Helianthus annuus]